jgi:hypothetical protein
MVESVKSRDSRDDSIALQKSMADKINSLSAIIFICLSKDDFNQETALWFKTMGVPVKKFLVTPVEVSAENSADDFFDKIIYSGHINGAGELFL